MKKIIWLFLFIFVSGQAVALEASVGPVTVTVKKKTLKKAKNLKPHNVKKRVANKTVKKLPPVAVAVVPVKSPEVVALEQKNATLEADRLAALADAERNKQALVAATVETAKQADERARAEEALAALKAKQTENETNAREMAMKVAKKETFIGGGVVFGSRIGVSASPISSVGFAPSAGYALSLIGPTSVNNVAFMLGMSSQKYNVSLSGTSLGNAASTTLTAGLRYNFSPNNKYGIIPVVGVGLYTTDFPETLLLNNTLKLKAATMSGAMFELGVRRAFLEHYSMDVMFAQYFGSAGDVRLETDVHLGTNAGAAQLTMVGRSNPSNFTVVIRRSFTTW